MQQKIDKFIKRHAKLSKSAGFSKGNRKLAKKMTQTFNNDVKPRLLKPKSWFSRTEQIPYDRYIIKIGKDEYEVGKIENVKHNLFGKQRNVVADYTLKINGKKQLLDKKIAEKLYVFLRRKYEGRSLLSEADLVKVLSGRGRV